MAILLPVPDVNYAQSSGQPAGGAVFYELAVHMYESHLVLRCHLNKW